MGISSPLAALTALYLLTSLPARAADQKIEVELSRLPSALSERLDKPRSAKLILRDGHLLEGMVTLARTEGLFLQAKKAPSPSQLVLYRDIAEIRLDLGPKRAWKIGGAILGLFTVGYFAMAITYESSDTAQNIGAITAVTAGPYFSAKLGARHRKWLIISTPNRTIP